MTCRISCFSKTHKCSEISLKSKAPGPNGDSRFSIFCLHQLFAVWFKLAGDMNGIHEGATICLLSFFMKKKVTAVLSSWTKLRAKYVHRIIEEGASTMYCKIWNYVLETHDSVEMPVEMPAETDAEIMRFTRLSTGTPINYVKLLRASTLRFNLVYDKYILSTT